jgi:hypothetical protein
VRRRPRANCLAQLRVLARHRHRHHPVTVTIPRIDDRGQGRGLAHGIKAIDGRAAGGREAGEEQGDCHIEPVHDRDPVQSIEAVGLAR